MDTISCHGLRFGLGDGTSLWDFHRELYSISCQVNMVEPVCPQTEQDFAEIAAAGLNWVRIPIGFWVSLKPSRYQLYLCLTTLAGNRGYQRRTLPGRYLLDILPQSVSFEICYIWTIFLLSLERRIQWARKYGIRIYLDLHALPGSQNGWVSIVWMAFSCVYWHLFMTSRTTRVKVGTFLEFRETVTDQRYDQHWQAVLWICKT